VSRGYFFNSHAIIRRCPAPELANSRCSQPSRTSPPTAAANVAALTSTPQNNRACLEILSFGTVSRPLDTDLLFPPTLNMQAQ